MTNLTKDLIKKTFVSLLERMPLTQITVKMIVEGCGINRNSFYYHYQDLPALIEEIVREDRVCRYRAIRRDRLRVEKQESDPAHLQLCQPRHFRTVSLEGLRSCR